MWGSKRLAAFGAVALLVCGGCGSSADGDNSAPVTKAAFIREADAICAKADSAQNKAISTFRKKSPEARADSRRSWEEQLILDAGIPAIEHQADELSALTVPSGDEARIDAIVAGLEAAVVDAKRDPGSMLERGSVGPFTEVSKLAKSYGFKACSTPI